MTEGHRCPFLGCDTNVEKRGNGVGSVAFHDAGQYTDSESKLQYLRARYYDPHTQQFLTVDPIADQTGQPYAYTGDNPVKGADPSGMCSASAKTGDFVDSWDDPSSKRQKNQSLDLPGLLEPSPDPVQAAANDAALTLQWIFVKRIEQICDGNSPPRQFWRNLSRELYELAVRGNRP
jgi:RHS repeat-associated protein